MQTAPHGLSIWIICNWLFHDDLYLIQFQIWGSTLHWVLVLYKLWGSTCCPGCMAVAAYDIVMLLLCKFYRYITVTWLSSWLAYAHVYFTRCSLLEFLTATSMHRISEKRNLRTDVIWGSTRSQQDTAMLAECPYHDCPLHIDQSHCSWSFQTDSQPPHTPWRQRSRLYQTGRVPVLGPRTAPVATSEAARTDAVRRSRRCRSDNEDHHRQLLTLLMMRMWTRRADR